MTICTNKASGIFAMVVGAIASAFAVVGVVISLLQRALLSTMPVNKNATHMEEMILAANQINLIHLPFMLLGGLTLAFSGYRLTNDSNKYRRIAQVIVTLGFVWTISYAFSIYNVNQNPQLNGPELSAAFFVLQTVSILFTTLIPATILGVLMYSLTRRPSDCGEPHA